LALTVFICGSNCRFQVKRFSKIFASFVKIREIRG